MSQISFEPISVRTDGGSREGWLVLDNTHLVAVFTRVTAEEFSAGQNQAEGWFLEAGFGPCGPLMTSEPPVFASLEEAREWVCGRLAAQPLS